MKQRRLLVMVLVSLIAGLTSVMGTTAVATAATGPGRHTYTGSIDGAEYRVETPERWNGTLVLFSHGYIPDVEGVPPGITLSVRAETEQWLLEQGFAVAGSDYKGRFGMAVGPSLTPGQAPAAWDDLSRTLGPTILGFTPLLANEAGGASQRIVLGPAASLAEATAVCGRLERASVPCEPMPYVGAPLAQ